MQNPIKSLVASDYFYMRSACGFSGWKNKTRARGISVVVGKVRRGREH